MGRAEGGATHPGGAALGHAAGGAAGWEIVHEERGPLIVGEQAGGHGGASRRRQPQRHAAEMRCCTPRAGNWRRCRARGLVHRIDKDTSGLLVVGAHPGGTHHAWWRRWQAREFERSYVAVALGVMTGGGPPWMRPSSATPRTGYA